MNNKLLIKKERKRKAQSLMISYVILIAIVISLSIGVFTWLKYLANVEPPVNCKDDTSVILTSLRCGSTGIKLDLKNNGRFSIDGIILTISNETELTNPVYLVPSRIYNNGLDPGTYYFDYKLKPNDIVTADYSNKERKLEGTTGYGESTDVNLEQIKTIQIQPFILDKRGIIICQNALIQQDVDGCSFSDELDIKYIQGLVGWWGFDGSLWNNAPGGTQDTFYCNSTDCIGVDPNYILSKSEQAIEFDGIDDYVKVPNDPSLNPSNITVSAWAKSNTEDWNNDGFLVSKRKSYILHPINNTKSVSYYINNGTWNFVAITLSDITKWHMYTYTYDGSDLIGYIDGIQNGSKAYSGSINSSSNPLYIGFDDAGTPKDRYFNGSIDDVMIFNRALNASEISAIYNSYD